MKRAEVRVAGAPVDVEDVADALDFYDLPTERAAELAEYLSVRRASSEQLARQYNERQADSARPYFDTIVAQSQQLRSYAVAHHDDRLANWAQAWVERAQAEIRQLDG